MKVIIIDPVTTKYSHASFNATIIEAIGKSKATDSLIVCLEENQTKLPVIQDAFDNLTIDIEINPWININTNSRLGHLLKTLKIYFWFYKMIQREKPNRIFFLAADNLFSPLLALILKIKGKISFDIFIILHNNLENIQDSVIKRKLWSLVFQKNIIGLVLANFVKEKSVVKFPDAQISTIEHPIYKHLSISQSNQNVKQYKTDFLILGRHSNAFKDNELSTRFFSACSKFSNLKKITVAIKKDATPSKNYPNIEVEGYSFPLGDDEYWGMLHTSRFLVIPPESASRVTASGVLADALTANLLIIAPNLGAFSEFIPSSCHDLLYDDDIEKAINFALSLTHTEYSKKRYDVKKKAEQYSLDRTIMRLNDIIDYEGQNI